MKGSTLAAPGRLDKEDKWRQFIDDVGDGLLHLFVDRGVKFSPGQPFGEHQWRELALALALESGELSIEFEGALFTPLTSIEAMDGHPAVQNDPDYRPAFEIDQLKDELFRFFYQALLNEQNGLHGQPIHRAMWKRFYRRKTLFVKEHGFGLANYHLMSKFQLCCEIDRIKNARRRLNLSLENRRGRKKITKTEAALYAAAEIYLWTGDEKHNVDINALGDSIRANRNHAVGTTTEGLHPRYRFFARHARVRDAIEQAARRLSLPLSPSV